MTSELVAAKLTRISVLENTYRNDPSSTYLQATGVLNGVDMTHSIRMGGQVVSLEDFLTGIYNAKVGADSTLSTNEFISRLRNLGFRYGTGATILWHHFGVDPNDLASIVETLKGHGIEDRTNTVPEERRTRIKEIYEFGEGRGLEVSAFEVTRTDRNESWTNQGFRNFVEAAVDSVARTLRLRQEARFHTKLAEEATEADVISTERAIATHLLRESNAWASNLGGVQQRKRNGEGNEIFEVGEENAPTTTKIDATSVPIGRIRYMAGDPATERTLDFWRRNDTAPAQPAPIAAPLNVAEIGSSDTDDEEDPF
jgi:hypothetical protein